MNIDMCEVMSGVIDEIGDDKLVLSVLTLLRDDPFRTELAAFIDAAPGTRAVLTKVMSMGAISPNNDNDERVVG